MNLSIIIPTISGREESLTRTLTAYRELTKGEFEQIIVRDRPNWPSACNEGRQRATGDILHFGADDLVPYGDWLTPCLPVLAAGELPAAHVWNHTHDGEPDNACDGPAGELTVFTRVPTLTREMADRIGDWPNIDYYADNWVSDAARANGWPTRLVAGYEFVHYWHQHGRLDTPERVEAARTEYGRLRVLL